MKGAGSRHFFQQRADMDTYILCAFSTRGIFVSTFQKTSVVQIEKMYFEESAKMYHMSHYSSIIKSSLETCLGIFLIRFSIVVVMCCHVF